MAAYNASMRSTSSTRTNLVLLALVVIASTQASAQGRRPGPDSFDPSKFIPNFSGQTDQQREAELAKVQLSLKEEARIGQQEIDAFKQRLAGKKRKLSSRGRDVEYIATLVGRLQPQMSQAKRYRKIQVWIYDDEQPQAYAICGGQILLSQGMLDQVGSEAALVCVLGHELAHLDRGHLLRRAKQWKLMEKRFAPSGEFRLDELFRSLDAMQQLFRRPFGPEEELEADRDGITWAYKLGYDPQAIEGLYAALDHPGELAMPPWMQSHPPSAERRENLSLTVAALKKKHPAKELILGEENLHRREAAERE